MKTYLPLDVVCDPWNRLTNREREVAAVLTGPPTLQDSEIANALGLSRHTVSVHLSRIRQKLDIRSRTDLAMIVAERRRGGV